tara:strand:- start:648 stop:893 length:246 start_codon:yes stop_codon:yes gene_type:complete
METDMKIEEDVIEITELPAPAEVTYRHYESREKEPAMFDCAGIRPTRNFSSGRLEWEVEDEDAARFERHHFLTIGRIVRKY